MKIRINVAAQRAVREINKQIERKIKLEIKVVRFYFR